MPEADTTSRHAALLAWAAERHGIAPAALDLRLAADDASFRRYFRLVLPDGTQRILMDAPPDKEDSAPFVAIARRWADAGLPVPDLYAVDLDAGFLELEDLGDTPLQHCFETSEAPITQPGTTGPWHCSTCCRIVPTRQDCRPTTPACWVANWTSSRPGAWSAGWHCPPRQAGPRFVSR